MRLVQGMYADARSRVHVGEGFSQEFEVKIGVHQGSVLSPLLLIIVLEAFTACILKAQMTVFIKCSRGIANNMGPDQTGH